MRVTGGRLADQRGWSPLSALSVRRHDGRPEPGEHLLIFPAVGLAVFATRAKRVTDELFMAAARAAAEQLTRSELDAGLLYPPQSDILKTEIASAVKVCEIMFARGLAGCTGGASAKRGES
jgi:malate dehydrogenase (oxaloacetate-decarboxylating)(NADP+)